MSGDTELSQPGARKATLFWWIEARDAWKYPTIHKAAPHPKNYPAPYGHSDKVEKS